MRDTITCPHVEEIRWRIVNHVERSTHGDLEIRHLWSGYLIALAEWGLIDDEAYGVLRDQLYRLTN